MSLRCFLVTVITFSWNNTLRSVEPAGGVDREQGVAVRCFRVIGIKWPLAQCYRDDTMDVPEERMLKLCTIQVWTMNTKKTRTYDPTWEIHLTNVNGTIYCDLKRIWSWYPHLYLIPFNRSFSIIKSCITHLKSNYVAENEIASVLKTRRILWSLKLVIVAALLNL